MGMGIHTRVHHFVIGYYMPTLQWTKNEMKVVLITSCWRIIHLIRIHRNLVLVDKIAFVHFLWLHICETVTLGPMRQEGLENECRSPPSCDWSELERHKKARCALMPHRADVLSLHRALGSWQRLCLHLIGHMKGINVWAGLVNH